METTLPLEIKLRRVVRFKTGYFRIYQNANGQIPWIATMCKAIEHEIEWPAVMGITLRELFGKMRLEIAKHENPKIKSVSERLDPPLFRRAGETIHMSLGTKKYQDIIRDNIP